MHVPDGFLGAPASITTGIVAAATSAVALRRSRNELQQTGPARAGLTAAFVFAAQMVNFPVGAGTSGHLIGAALAAALVGPWTAVLTMACVLVVQALVFADGGVTALGTNILLLGPIPILAATLVSRTVLAAARSRRALVAPAAGIGAFVSVPVAALTFSGLYALGGAVEVPLGMLTAAMTGTHLLIGVGEGLITAAVIGAVMAARPDLVQLWSSRAPAPALLVTDADGRTVEVPADPVADRPLGAGRYRLGHRALLVGLGVTLAVAAGLSLLASAWPDGLESVAAALGFDRAARESVTAGSPLADYALLGAGGFSGSLAGVAGVALTLGLGLAVAGLGTLGRRRPPVPAESSPPERRR